MSLSKYLQSPDILQVITGTDNEEELRSFVLDKCREWYTSHPEESELIRNNLQRFNIPYTDKCISEIEQHIFLHYYEKFLPHIKSPKEYYTFLKDHTDCHDAVQIIKDALSMGRGILLPTAHFGGIEFIIPCLSMHKLPLNAAARFTTEQFSKQVHAYAKKMRDCGFFGRIRLIEIGKPGTLVALEMAAVLRRKEVLFSIFDEKTDYSIPVTLFGKHVWGGAGLDRLLQFLKEAVSVFTLFMIRTGQDSYKLQLIEIDPTSSNPIQDMFTSLENIVKDNIEQWYFLHEEIPFVDDAS